MCEILTRSGKIKVDDRTTDKLQNSMLKLQNTIYNFNTYLENEINAWKNDNNGRTRTGKNDKSANAVKR